MSMPSHLRKVLDCFLQGYGVQRLLLICSIVAVLTVFERMPYVFLPGMSADSYAYLQDWPALEQLAGQWRFGQSLVLQVLEWFAVDPLAFANVLQGVGFAAFGFCFHLLFSSFASAQQIYVFPLCIAALFVTLDPWSTDSLTVSEESFTALLVSEIVIFAAFLTSSYPRLMEIARINFCGRIVIFATLRTTYEVLVCR